eukprot:TRINITY_DN1604_c0_g1_i1.p1 TRINITY_DN1604_c0_g1~~TRINITY_DN1604_c0_g1_i1.p1  ORF type:complete len:146 (+),score=31.30 TRINITY_DN1604_c0_g1_i1:72-509(+)
MSNGYATLLISAPPGLEPWCEDSKWTEQGLISRSTTVGSDSPSCDTPGQDLMEEFESFYGQPLKINPKHLERSLEQSQAQDILASWKNPDVIDKKQVGAAAVSDGPVWVQPGSGKVFIKQFCQMCGSKRASDESKFCTECGAALS